MDMTLGQINGFSTAITRLETAAMTRAALAARVAQADEKNWSKIMREWQRGE